MNNFIDTHTHLFVEDFNEDRDAVVARAVAAEVERLCLPCINADSIEPIKDMCRRYPGVCYPMIGLHPTDVADDYRCRLEWMHEQLQQDDSYIAVGEVGIDLYWDTTYEQQQIEAFETQIGWACNYHLPMVIHSRNAFDKLYAQMQTHRAAMPTGIFHCFSGNAEEARKLLSFDGFMLGIGGVLTYKKSALAHVLVEAVPLSRIVLETDSPYLAPVPYRGRRNESAYIVEVAKFLSLIYGVTVEEVAHVTSENALKIFTKIVR